MARRLLVKKKLILFRIMNNVKKEINISLSLFWLKLNSREKSSPFIPSVFNIRFFFFSKKNLLPVFCLISGCFFFTYRRFRWAKERFGSCTGRILVPDSGPCGGTMVPLVRGKEGTKHLSWNHFVFFENLIFFSKFLFGVRLFKLDFFFLYSVSITFSFVFFAWTLHLGVCTGGSYKLYVESTIFECKNSWW